MFNVITKKLPSRFFYTGTATAFLGGMLAICLIAWALLASVGEWASTGHKRLEVLTGVDTLRKSSDNLTRFARMYAVTRNPEFAENYRYILDIRNGTAPYPEGYDQIYWDFPPATRQRRHPDGPPRPMLERIEELPLVEQESVWMQLSHDNSDRLAVLETEMFDTMDDPEKGETAKLRARDSIFSEEYREVKSAIMKPLDGILSSVEYRYREIEAQIRDRVILLLIILAAASVKLVSFARQAAARYRQNTQSVQSGGLRFLFYALAAVMLVSGAGLFYTYLRAADTAYDTVKVHQVANEMRRSSDDLTRLARLYAITGNPQYAEDYQTVLKIRGGKQKRPVNYHHIYWELLLEHRRENHPPGPPRSLEELIAETDASPEEAVLIQTSRALSDNLASAEVSVFAVFADKSADEFVRNGAVLALFGDDYLRYKSNIMSPIDDLLSALKRRYAESRDRAPKTAAVLVLVFGAALAVFAALLFRLARRADTEGGAPPS